MAVDSSVPNGTQANGHPSSYAAKHNLAPHFIGGNNIAVAPSGKVKDFVAANDGHTVITNVRNRLTFYHTHEANKACVGAHRK